MLSKKEKIQSIFFYIGIPIYRLLLAATLALALTWEFVFKALQSIKLPKPKFHFYLIAFILLSLATYYSYLFFSNLPNPQILENFPNKVSTKILDRNGNLLYQIYKDENRSLVSINNLPQHIKLAFLAAEDKEFYNHHGFSVTGLVRAVYKNTFNQKVEGGSTITQQLVKNTLLTNEKTLIRKIKELVLSLQVETLYTKDKILEIYLNQVGFGGPAYGIQEAAKQYFDINAQDLSIAQSAYLAGITRAPTKYSPFGENLSLGLDRQKIVLAQMHQNGYITSEEYKKSLEESIIFRSAKNDIVAPHFVMLVRSLLIENLGETAVNQGGLEVTTTLDSALQKEIQKIVTKETSSISHLNVNNGAALVTNPKTGEVLAMVGSKDYFDFNNNGQVNLTTSLRQPGSSIKPLNYALAFENGKKPTDTIEDKPISIIYPNKEVWSPKNYDNKFHGTVTLKSALANSYNIPSVLLLQQNGITNFANFAKKLGIKNWNDPSRYGFAMGLGSLEVKMTELATAYSAFANSGISTPLNLIKEIRSEENMEKPYLPKCLSDSENQNNEKLIEEDNCSPKRVISTQTAEKITDILSDNNARSLAFGVNSVLNIKGHKVAVKTGTSNNLRDNWTIGYNQTYLVASWVGNNDSKPMSNIASGVTGASPIWSKIFQSLLTIKLASN